MKKNSQLEKVFTIYRRLSKAYFVYENTFQKKPDDPTGVLVWKDFLCKMEIDAITILV